MFVMDVIIEVCEVYGVGDVFIKKILCCVVLLEKVVLDVIIVKL